MRSLVLVVCLATAFAGCIQAENNTTADDDQPGPNGTDDGDRPGAGGTEPDDEDPEDEPWYTQSGIQCEPPPWQVWASETGYEPEGERADEAFQNDDATVETIEAYYDTQEVTFDEVVAYRDDLFRAQYCGNTDGRYYWVRGAEGPFEAEEDGWEETEEEPQVQS